MFLNRNHLRNAEIDSQTHGSLDDSHRMCTQTQIDASTIRK